MENASNIALLDNTVPSQQQLSGEEPSRRTTRHERQGSLSKHLSRTAVQSQISKLKYVKWQPERFGILTEADSPRASTSSIGGPSGRSTQQDSHIDAPGSVSLPDQGNSNNNGQSTNAEQQTNNRSDDSKPLTELDVLYENQRGWFFFGLPLYSHNSLLQFDPAAWMTQDRNDSPVNITNAQLPDPSWEWAWPTWYVDMSGDVDEQGWQYSFSFASSAWHGTHPWFHSFVRRRRWVRLRVKISERRHGRSDLEAAHMLNEDYFTIHSAKLRSREQSSTAVSQLASAYLSRVGTKVDEDMYPEEIRDIPALMQALKQSSIDRQRINALKRFVQEGGEEIYYLNDKIAEIMSMFLFQTSRWQFVSYLLEVIHELSQQVSNDPGCDSKDIDAIKRKQDNLTRAAETCKRHITGPDFFTDDHGESATEMLDLTPVSRHDTLSSTRPTSAPIKPPSWDEGHVIRGIPSAAEIGCEGHIY